MSLKLVLKTENEIIQTIHVIISPTPLTPINKLLFEKYLTFTNELKTGFEIRKVNYTNKKWNYISYFLTYNQHLLTIAKQVLKGGKGIIQTGNGINSSTS